MLFSAPQGIESFKGLVEVDNINNVNTCPNVEVTRATGEADH